MVYNVKAFKKARFKMKTVSIRQNDVVKKWVLIDATNLVVGRLASFIASRLRGNHLASYTPNIDDGDNIIVINAQKIHFTGNKLTNKKYYKHTGYPGGIKMKTAENILSSNFPERVLKKAVERMMPSGPLANKQLKNLKIYSGSEHPHVSQKPELLDFKSMNDKNGKR